MRTLDEVDTVSYTHLKTVFQKEESRFAVFWMKYSFEIK